MARKHFEEYYDCIQRQVNQLSDTLRDLENTVNNEVIDPDKIENVKSMLKPLTDSFKALCYVKYLLDKPTRKSKQNRYNKQYEVSEPFTTKNIKALQDVEEEVKSWKNS